MLIKEKQSSKKNKIKQKNIESKPLVAPTIFEDGTKVVMEVVKLTTDDQQSNKLKYEFKGPFTVIRRNKNNKVYYLKDEIDEELLHPESIDRLRQWTEREMDDDTAQQPTIKQLSSDVNSEGENKN